MKYLLHQGSYHGFRGGPPCPLCHHAHPPVVIHRRVCQHQIEVEVSPASAEVYFRDERYVDPVNTQVRFEAVVYNAPSARVRWEVTDLAGHPGAGSIDPAGLYVAPPKGSLAHGTTDLVIATAVDDPFRRAVARVTLIGNGPETRPQPRIEIVPKVAHVYYDKNHTGDDHNEFMENSSKVRQFWARIKHSASRRVRWTFDGATPPDATDDPWYTYQAQAQPSGSDAIVEARVTLVDNPSVTDWGTLFLVNYRWPGILP